jgi:hypothetical protein
MIIGLVGRARSGKDTAARALAPEYTIKRLAQPVKDACKALYGWTDYALESDAKEVVHDFWGTSPRQTMVHLTQKLKDHMGHDFFTRRFFAEWDGQTPIVIPDVRYAPDVEEIHRRGGVTIKIIRPGVHLHEFESEIPLLKTTWTIENTGTEEDLQRKIKEVLKLKA